MASSFPTLRALGGAWRRAREAASFSSTIVRHKTGAHLYRIDNYSRVAGTMPAAAALPGHRIESAPFVVGGHKFQLHLYPNGADKSASQAGHASVHLDLRGGGRVTAAYEVSVLDGEGNRVLGRAFRPRSIPSLSYEDPEVVATAAEMRAAATRGGKEDGGIVVRCDVTVMELEEESRIGWCLLELVSKF